MILAAFIAILVLVTSPINGDRVCDRRYRSLKFEQTLNSTIMFQPNFQPLQDGFTVCSWVKKLRSEGAPAWFSYFLEGNKNLDNEIAISDDGYLNYIFDQKKDIRKNVTVPVGSWTHYCMSWSAASHKQRIYYNGTETESQRTPNFRKLGLGGYLVIGNDQDCYGGCFTEKNIFGGELYKLNVFSRELSKEDISEMWRGGLCSELEEKYGKTRYLKWEDILLERRNGTVTEESTGCGKGRYGRWDFLETLPFYEQVLTSSLLDELQSGLNILGAYIFFVENIML